jgi:hypothetical protein
MKECSRFEDTLTTCSWLCKLTATVQDISWRGLQAPVETYKRKELRAGAAAHLAAVIRPRKWRRFYTKGSKTGQPMVIRNTAPESTVRGGLPLRVHVGLGDDGCSPIARLGR